MMKKRKKKNINNEINLKSPSTPRSSQKGNNQTPTLNLNHQRNHGNLSQLLR